MLQTTTIIAGAPSTPPVSPSHGSTGREDANAKASEGSSTSFANVLGERQRKLPEKKATADTPNEKGTSQAVPDSQVEDTAGAPWPLLPPGMDWLAAVQAAAQNVQVDGQQVAETATAHADSGQPDPLIAAALPPGSDLIRSGDSKAGSAPIQSSSLPTPVAATIATTPARMTDLKADGLPAGLARGMVADSGEQGTASVSPNSANVAGLPAADAIVADASRALGRETKVGGTAEFRMPDMQAVMPAVAMGQPASREMLVPPGHADLHITTPIGGRQWESAIGNSLVLMTGAHQQRAELVLTPPQLGRIEVSLSMTGDQANAVFVSANPAVREALENAMPRLREILADAGVTLGQAQVGAESFRQPTGERQNGDNPGRGADSGVFGEIGPMKVVAAIGSPITGAARGLVDVFV